MPRDGRESCLNVINIARDNINDAIVLMTENMDTLRVNVSKLLFYEIK